MRNSGYPSQPWLKKYQNEVLDTFREDIHVWEFLSFSIAKGTVCHIFIISASFAFSKGCIVRHRLIWKLKIQKNIIIDLQFFYYYINALLELASLILMYSHINAFKKCNLFKRGKKLVDPWLFLNLSYY